VEVTKPSLEDDKTCLTQMRVLLAAVACNWRTAYTLVILI